MVGHLNTCKAFNAKSFKGAFRSLWQLSGTVDVQTSGKRVLFTFTHERDIARVKKGGTWSFQRAMVVVNDFDGVSSIDEVPLAFVWIWVQIHGIPPTFLMMATITLIGETLGPVLMVDQCGVREELAKVRVALPLHKHVFLEKKVTFSPMEEYGLTFKYGRLLVCAQLNHVEAPCPDIVPSGVPSSAVSLSSLVSGVTTPSLVFHANIPQTLSSSLFFDVSFSEVFPKEKRGVVIKPMPPISVVAVSAPLCITGIVRGRDVEEE